MRNRRLLLAWILAALAFFLAACGAPPAPAGSRHWVVSVENASAQPARLFVAEDRHPMGPLAGTAFPDVVPPLTTQDVVFTVPPGTGWAIFVNPTAERGPLILARDVPADMSGPLPITIGVSREGEPFAGTQAELGPGWFGQ